MSLRLLIDMNLTPDWVAEFAAHGHSAVHWSAVGNPRATDADIMVWAIANDYVVFTHDLDFGTALTLTNAGAPSVVQIRGSSVLPEDIGPLVFAAIKQHESDLSAGALMVIDQRKLRLRILPLRNVGP